MRNQRGVTLIALVITIIVLLILAGVSIAMLTGDNGILTQSNKAKYNTARAEAVEKINLALNAVKTEVYSQRVSKSDWNPLNGVELQDTIKSVLTSDGFKNTNGDNVYYFNVDAGILTLSYYSVPNANLDSGNPITGKIDLNMSAATFLDLTKASLPANT